MIDMSILLSRLDQLEAKIAKVDHSGGQSVLT